MATADDFVSLLLSQEGDRYVFGVEVSMSDSNPSAFDCSELVQWGCGYLHVTPVMPDGSWNQAKHCQTNGTLIPIDQAIATKGALLFSFSSSPFEGTRPTHSHVAVSRGDGTTIEARGTRYGVGSWTAYNRGWTHAALVPGLEYPVNSGGSTLTFPELRIHDGYLRYGRQNLQQWVRKLQALLAVEGYIAANTFDANHKPDGLYGPGTKDAVARFEQDHNIAVDGIADRDVWEALLT